MEAGKPRKKGPDDLERSLTDLLLARYDRLKTSGILIMRKILLHDIQFDIGGPNTVLNAIEHSRLSRKYTFERICQKGGCGLNPLKALRFVLHYRKAINRAHGDAIYICGLQYVGFLMTLAAKLSNVGEVIVSVHGSDWDVEDKTLRRKVLKYIIEPLEVRMADKIFTVCRAEQEKVKALKFARRGCNCGTIYNTFPSIDYTKVAPGALESVIGSTEGKTVVAVVGRVTERKGHAYIIEALKKCKDSRYVFVIIGDGDYLQHYRERCAEEIAQRRLFLLGNRNDVVALLRDVDIFLFATLNENHSMALLEAVAMHCAALVTAVGGNTETIEDGVSGVVIPPADSDAIVEGLHRLADSQVRERYARSAFQYCRSAFSEENTLGKLDRLFEQ